MNLPKHISLRIEHNPHRANYETVEQRLELNEVREDADITPEDRAEMQRTGEVWVIYWCPDTPVGSCSVAAATLEKALHAALGGIGVACPECLNEWSGCSCPDPRD